MCAFNKKNTKFKNKCFVICFHCVCFSSLCFYIYHIENRSIDAGVIVLRAFDPLNPSPHLLPIVILDRKAILIQVRELEEAGVIMVITYTFFLYQLSL